MENLAHNIITFLTKPLFSAYVWMWNLVFPWVQSSSLWRQNRTDFISKYPDAMIMGSYSGTGNKAYYLDSYIASSLHGKPTDSVSVVYVTHFSSYWKPVDALVLHESGAIVRHRPIMESLVTVKANQIIRFTQKYQLIQPGYPLTSRQSKGFKDINFSSNGRLFVSRIDPETSNGEIYEIEPPDAAPELKRSILNCKATKWLDIPSSHSWQGYFSISDRDVLYICANEPGENGKVKETNAAIGSSVQLLTAVDFYEEPNRSIQGFDLYGPSQIYYTSNENYLTVADIKNKTQVNYAHFSSLDSAVTLDYSVRKLRFNKVALTSSGVELDPFLRLNPKIRSKMVWWFIDESKKDPVGEWLPYDKWPSYGKVKLFDAYNKIRNNQNPEFPEISKEILEPEASKVYYAYTAFTLWVEINKKVSWSLSDLKGSEISNDECLYMMLDGRHMFDYAKEKNKDVFYYGHHYYDKYYNSRKHAHRIDAFPAQPRFIFDFLFSNGLIKSTIEDTIREIIRWYQSNLHHGIKSRPWIWSVKVLNDLPVKSAYYSPIEWMLTKRDGETAQPDSGGKHWAWAGCHSASALTHTLLRILNIPSQVWAPLIVPDSWKYTGITNTYGHAALSIPTEDILAEHMDHFYANLPFLRDLNFDPLKIFMTRKDAKGFFETLINAGDKVDDVEQALFKRLALLALKHPTTPVVILAWKTVDSVTENQELEVYRALRKALGVHPVDDLESVGSNYDQNSITDLSDTLDYHSSSDQDGELSASSPIVKLLNTAQRQLYNKTTIEFIKTNQWKIFSQDEIANTSLAYYLDRNEDERPNVDIIWINIRKVIGKKYAYYRVNEPVNEYDADQIDYKAKKHAIKKAELIKISKDLVTLVKDYKNQGTTLEGYVNNYKKWIGSRGWSVNLNNP